MARPRGLLRVPPWGWGGGRGAGSSVLGPGGCRKSSCAMKSVVLRLGHPALAPDLITGSKVPPRTEKPGGTVAIPAENHNRAPQTSLLLLQNASF